MILSRIWWVALNDSGMKSLFKSMIENLKLQSIKTTEGMFHIIG